MLIRQSLIETVNIWSGATANVWSPFIKGFEEIQIGFIFVKKNFKKWNRVGKMKVNPQMAVEPSLRRSVSAYLIGTATSEMHLLRCTGGDR